MIAGMANAPLLVENVTLKEEMAHVGTSHHPILLSVLSRIGKDEICLILNGFGDNKEKQVGSKIAHAIKIYCLLLREISSRRVQSFDVCRIR